MLKLLSMLDVMKATGHDMISAKLSKNVAPSIAGSLTTLFNASLTLGQFPTEWKYAVITPVPKAGGDQLVTNYQQVSVFPITC